MTPKLFRQWKDKKMAAKEAALAANQAERAKNDRMSGRELFLSDASLFVDDAEAYEKYQREESDGEEKAIQAIEIKTSEPGTSKPADENEFLDDDDDDDLDIDELNELEAILSRSTLEICEPVVGA